MECNGNDDFEEKLSTTQLMDLTPDCLKQIIEDIGIRNYLVLSKTCQHFKIMCGSLLKAKFLSVINKLAKSSEKTAYYSKVKIMRYATEVYVQSGFEDVFYRIMIPLMQPHNTKSHTSFSLSQAEFLLYRFLKSINGKLGNQQRALMLHGLTLLRLLKKFPTFQIMACSNNSLAYKVKILIRGSYIGVLWPWQSKLSENPYTLVHILIMLSILLIAIETNTNIQCMPQYNGEPTYIIGNNISIRPRRPQMVFQITINASMEIRELFHKCLIDEAAIFTCPKIWPDGRLNIMVDILSKEAIKAGGVELKNIDCSADTFDKQ